MRNTQAYYFWVALFTLMRSAFSEKADCGDGLELNTRQGDQSTFSIPLNETCSAALITFSDGTDLVLDLRTNSSCPYASSEAQTFTTVIGSDTPEGVATLTFQCSGQVYCMSIDVVTANISDSQTSIHSVCVNTTETALESLGAVVGATQASGVSNGSMPEGSMMTSTTIRSSSLQALQGNSSMTKALLGSSTGFSTIQVNLGTLQMLRVSITPIAVYLLPRVVQLCRMEPPSLLPPWWPLSHQALHTHRHSRQQWHH
jgi:hypothetical protein